MKRTSILGWTLLITATGAVLAFRSLHSVNSDARSDVPIATRSEGMVYRNPTYGFSLQFPQAWQGYKTATHVHGESGGDYAEICFWFPDPHPFICVVQVTLFTKQQWKNLTEDSMESSSVDFPRYQVRRFVLYFDGVTDKSSPEEITCLQLDDFQCARRKELPAIVKSLRVLSL